MGTGWARGRHSAGSGSWSDDAGHVSRAPAGRRQDCRQGGLKAKQRKGRSGAPRARDPGRAEPRARTCAVSLCCATVLKGARMGGTMGGWLVGRVVVALGESACTRDHGGGTVSMARAAGASRYVQKSDPACVIFLHFPRSDEYLFTSRHIASRRQRQRAHHTGAGLQGKKIRAAAGRRIRRRTWPQPLPARTPTNFEPGSRSCCHLRPPPPTHLRAPPFTDVGKW